jgi:hypothetical protein
MYEQAVVHKSPAGPTIAEWPKPTQGPFTQGSNDTCYEWYDKPIAIYSLCFKNGVLADKAIG